MHTWIIDLAIISDHQISENFYIVSPKIFYLRLNHFVAYRGVFYVTGQNFMAAILVWMAVDTLSVGI